MKNRIRNLFKNSQDVYWGVKRLFVLKRMRHRQSPLLVNLGCGYDYKKGWLNIDRYVDKVKSKELDVLTWDLSRELPFDFGAVDFVFNEHFLEHLSYSDGLDFLTRVHKTLKINGILRISCPDLREIATNYLNSTWDLNKWRMEIPSLRSGCDLFNHYVSYDYWEHRFMYDEEELVNSLKLAGFRKIVKKPVGVSDISLLVGLEVRTNSIVFEATK